MADFGGMAISALFGGAIGGVEAEYNSLVKEEEETIRKSLAEFQSQLKREEDFASTRNNMMEEEHRQGLISSREKEKEGRDVVGYGEDGEPIYRSEYKKGMKLYDRGLSREKPDTAGAYEKDYNAFLKMGKSPEESARLVEEKYRHDSSFKPNENDTDEKVLGDIATIEEKKGKLQAIIDESSGTEAETLKKMFEEDPVFATMMRQTKQPMSLEGAKQALKVYDLQRSELIKRLSDSGRQALQGASSQGEELSQGIRSEASKNPGEFIKSRLANKPK